MDEYVGSTCHCTAQTKNTASSFSPVSIAMSQDHYEKSVRFIVQDEAESLSKVDLCKRLWDGTLLFSSHVYYENRWIPLESHPLLYIGPQGTLFGRNTFYDSD